MIQQKPKHLKVSPKDFSNQKYFPGTPGHPFHVIDKIQNRLSKVPYPIYALIIGSIVYLISADLYKAILITGFSIIDWLLLSLLPKLRISFGPPLLSSLILGLMRLPFLLFSLPITIALQLLGTFLVIYGFFIEPQYPRTSHYHISLPGENLAGETMKIVHLSDLHLEYFTARENRIIEKVNAYSPDLIFFTGDFFNLSYQRDQNSHDDIIKCFNLLKPRYGTFAVTGSPSVDLDEQIKCLLPRLNLTLLENKTFELVINNIPLHLIGLSCTHQPGNDFNRLKELMKPRNQKDSVINILLYHSPDISPHIQSMPIDLQFSGHTHGGQVQVPFLGPIYSGSLYGHIFSSGHYIINESVNLILSRGLGLEGEAAPRVRFFSPPEVGLITLEIISHNVE